MKIPFLNKVLFVGLVAFPPELKYTLNGVPVLTFQIKIGRQKSTGDPKEVYDYFTIIVWRDLAEEIAKDLKKGDLVYIEGRLRIRTYEKKTGERKSVLEIIAHEAHILNSTISEKEDANGRRQKEGF